MSIFGVRWLLNARGPVFNCFNLSDKRKKAQHPVVSNQLSAMFNEFDPYPCKKSSGIYLYLLNNMYTCVYIYIYIHIIFVDIHTSS